LQIDNCIVEVDREEMPGLDGSSAGYVAALRTAGLVVQASRRRRIVVERVCRVGDAENWVEISPTETGSLSVEYRLDYGSNSSIPKQSYSCQVTPDTFVRELAPARTFVTEEQAVMLRSRGLASHVTNRDLLVFGKDGPIGNLLRYHDECSRHKSLDLIGDLSILGADIVGSIVSCRGGHQLNGALAVELERMLYDSAGCRKAA
jgi:UDP-3-O-[3-hydroxymyristoyl] N-acetylglucosamine deacetylase/UDP-3-O-[3-hydroxymyristoyl] N-acetylglucosamine deacetylase/3-hydroxyacyl-[acyl-carrier-protein] dehydratase